MARNPGASKGTDAQAGWKKLLYGASIAIALGGSLVLIVFTFLLNDAIDKTRDLVLANLQDVRNDLTTLGGALSSAEDELGVVNTTMTDLQGSFVPLENGLHKTGDSINELADTASQVPFIGQTVPVTDLRNASASMEDAAAKLNQTAATFEQHKAKMDELRGSVDAIRQSVSAQESALDQSAASIASIFGLVKIANFLFFIVVISMFVMLVIDSAAGLL